MMKCVNILLNYFINNIGKIKKNEKISLKISFNCVTKISSD